MLFYYHPGLSSIPLIMANINSASGSGHQVVVKARMNTPVITRINPRPYLEQKGGAIVITDKDDCKVASVSLRIFNKAL